MLKLHDERNQIMRKATFKTVLRVMLDALAAVMLIGVPVLLKIIVDPIF